MIPAFVLVAGVMFVSLLGFGACYMMDIDRQVLWSMVPFLPLIVAAGSFMLILSEFFLIFGRREDRRTMFIDLCWLIPLFLISAGLFYYIHANDLY